MLDVGGWVWEDGRRERNPLRCLMMGEEVDVFAGNEAILKVRSIK